MKVKTLLLSVVASVFFAACSDSSAPTVPGVPGEEGGDIAYSTDAEGNQVPVSASSATSGEQNGPSNGQQNTTPQAPITDAPAVGSGKVNFPFPQKMNYNGNGIILSNQDQVTVQLKKEFDTYYSNYYKVNGQYAAIEKEPGGAQYVSEGTGYGMLMMVYFSDNTKSYQDEFDKLWAFYKAAENKNGLMNWTFGSLNPYDNGANAATDAEMDVAAALIMAAYQFGDNKYLTEAETLLKNVRAFEFNPNGLHRPGDNWDDKKNPSYVAPAYYRLYALVDKSGADFWNNSAMNANYTLLEANSAEYSTGLFDNWSDASGRGLDGKYGYDAARTPWRLAQDFYWNGEPRAKAMLDKLGGWVNSQNASSVRGSMYRNNGAPEGEWGHNSTFVGTLMTSLVTDASHQSKMDSFWSEVAGFGKEPYFEQSMKVLCGLLVSGNMPNLMALAAGQK